MPPVLAPPRTARRPWYRHPEAPAVVHAAAGLVCVAVAAAGGIATVPLLTAGVLVGMVIGAGGLRGGTGTALLAGSAAMPLAVLVPPLAWALTGAHLARALSGPVPARSA